MSVKTLTQSALTEINSSVEHTLSPSEIESISKIIEEKLIFAINESVQNCSNKAIHCCGPESDMAHKIAAEFKNAQHALIANLTSMR